MELAMGSLMYGGLCVRVSGADGFQNLAEYLTMSRHLKIMIECADKL